MAELPTIPISQLSSSGTLLDDDFFIMSRDTGQTNFEGDQPEQVYQSFKTHLSTYTKTIDGKYASTEFVSEVSADIQEKLDDLKGKVVYLDGTQTIKGAKTFIGGLHVDGGSALSFGNNGSSFSYTNNAAENILNATTTFGTKAAKITEKASSTKSEITLDADETLVKNVLKIDGKEVATKELVEEKTAGLGDIVQSYTLKVETWKFSVRNAAGKEQIVTKNIVVAVQK